MCGQATNPTRPAETVLLPTGATGTQDRLWHYHPDTGWTAKSLPASSRIWLGVDINPNNAQHWLIWSEGEAYVSRNAGQSWVRVEFPNATGILWALPFTCGAFTGIGEQWVVHRTWVGAFGTGRFTHGETICGSGLTRNKLSLTGEGSTTPYRGISNFVRGRGGELWAYGTTIPATSTLSQSNVGAPDQMFYVNGVTGAISDGAQTAYIPAMLLRKDGDAAVAVWENQLGYTANYKSQVATGVLAAGTRAVVCDISPTVSRIFTSQNGVSEVTNLLTNPAVNVIAGSGRTVSLLVGGSRRRGCAALLAESGEQSALILTFNGSLWANLPLPEGIGNIGAMGVPEP